jgi:hypothetical protein
MLAHVKWYFGRQTLHRMKQNRESCHFWDESDTKRAGPERFMVIKHVCKDHGIIFENRSCFEREYLGGTRALSSLSFKELWAAGGLAIGIYKERCGLVLYCVLKGLVRGMAK